MMCVACAGGRGEPLLTEPLTTTDVVASDGELPATVVANISYRDNPTNLIVNGDFEDYADPNIPDAWSIDEIYGYRGMFTPIDGWHGRAVRATRNSQGRHFLTQTVPVTPHHQYTAQLVYEVLTTDSKSGGLYVVDPGNASVIASDTMNRPSNGWRIASVTFDSGARTQVTLKVGYPNGMNATVLYDAVALYEAATTFDYQYQTTYRDAIGIAAAPVTDLVPQVSDYVTTLLAAPRAVRMAHRDLYAAVLPYYLYQFLSAPDGSGSRDSWCQRTSLALGELLQMYGVRTRQVHAPSPQHQFLEYFDGARWVVFDPYYGIRYVFAGVRLGVDDVLHDGFDQVSIEVPTRERVFLLELGFLRPIWLNASFTRGLDM
ncbi:MAG TPA: hypothetical protein VFP84_21845 [Kofleriaceae bacterium]|nr:hypothetical protein [Kofleriaceae bacterium]